MQNERTYDRQTQKSYVGIGANLGIPVVSLLQQVWEAGRGLRHARSKEDYINGGSRLASAGAASTEKKAFQQEATYMLQMEWNTMEATFTQEG